MWRAIPLPGPVKQRSSGSEEGLPELLGLC